MEIIFVDGSLEAGLEKNEVENALRDDERRCSKHDPDAGELIIFCFLRQKRKVIMIITEEPRGQTWWVVLARVANAAQREMWRECLEKRAA
jgi:hypothetical protein